MNKLDSDFAIRVYRKYGVLPVFHESVEHVNVRGRVEDNETFNQWCQRVLGTSHTNVELLGSYKIAPRMGMRRVLAEYKNDRLDSLLKAQARRAQATVKRRKTEGSDEAPDPVVVIGSTVTKSELAELVSEATDLLPENVREFFSRFTDQQLDESEWSEVFLSLVQAYARLAQMKRLELKDSSGDGIDNSDGAEVMKLDDVDHVALAAEKFERERREILPVESPWNHPRLNDLKEDYLLVGVQMLVIELVTELSDAFEIFLSSTNKLKDVASEVEEFKAMLEMEDVEDMIPPLSDVDDEDFNRAYRISEEKKAMDEMRYEMDGLYEQLECVESSIELAVESLLGSAQDLVATAGCEYISSARRLLGYM
jgi:hypothetical protein